jgi:hypothetical protein
MRQGSAKPVLRLVHADDVSAAHLSPQRNARPGARDAGERPGATRSSVARENHAAAGMSALDARWVFATQVAREIELSGAPRAGVLAPERRRNLVRLATRLGLRQFDANLVIAIVQDGCRSGDGAGGPLPQEVGDRLAMVRTAGPTSELGMRELALWLLASACLAVTIGLALTRWISGT